MRAPKPTVPIIERSSELTKWLDAAAEKIRKRDGLHWFDTGQELAAIKARLDHGQFEKWCKTKLSYSKSKVEKLMKAAAVFSEHYESGTVTVLPAATVAYQLSIKDLPEEIRKKYLPLAIAGQNVGPGLRKAIKAYRATKMTETANGRAPSSLAHKSQDVEQRAGHDDGADQSRTAILDLLEVRLGNDLSKLISYFDGVSGQAVFTVGAMHDLKERERIMRSTKPFRCRQSRDSGFG